MRLPFPRSGADHGRPATPHTGPARGASSPLHRFNAAAPAAARNMLLACCGSRRWAHRLAVHRPYPDTDALLAAADEAGYDMTHADLTEALTAESAYHPPTDGPGALAATTALRAGHAAYADRFGHAFIVHLDDFRPEERLDQALAGIRARLTNDADEERAVAAEELRQLARARLARLLTAPRAGATRP
ncbi:2-oxo-4-hydroxy-4-carboxy-5-ureidoimidazoline decarboxylase [Streptomyces sp. DSM 42041]|uniref:2-oxo-4-hydroxy-4-carboxy-5-ureidoimidazoline decarboxylase n=1 Tax=Streptomyces hazeniae TaxID=3075538 RepID=A0ABU2NUM9_9ACTN|nr:2-oxo-4-hydroxy-4-carboxy-5-ureidoimidazoline decarboxylase [Streptomyces sp. DSM 42041]MDT0380464.1 2-oxo-4-hydroxy-4-carboxy-5-ureidoimidazoline decarboxylase [Streptomyces sp. DSM 42041]